MTRRPQAGASDAVSRARVAVRRNARRARLVLTAERGLRAFWPVWTVAAIFLGLALSGAFEPMSPILHGALLAGFAAAMIWTLIAGARAFRMPTEAEARAELDRDTADHPVAALDDEQAVGAGDAASRTVWQAHRRRMAARAMTATPRAADLRLSSRDPWAVRLAALILLIFGGMAALLDGGERLEAALTPGLSSTGAGPIAPSAEAWATPPAYTGAAMIYLTERMGETVTVPEGSRISLRLYNAPEPPALEQGVAAAAAFAPFGEATWDLQIEAVSSGALAVSAMGGEVARWTLDVVADAPPAIAFAGAPGAEVGAAETGAMEVPFTASDDHGVAAAWAVVALDFSRLEEGLSPPPPGLGKPVEIELPLPFTGAVDQIDEVLIEDMTAHPWAGLPVTVTLHAEDARGQAATAGPIEAVLPTRPFYEPMAKAVLEERRSLAWSLSNARPAMQRLRAVTAYPEDYFKDVSPYLVIRAAIRRLDYALRDDRVAAEAGSAMDLLWRAALLLEDGDLSSALERLRRAQERLSKALEDGASNEEIARLTDELRQAMNEYLQEMARQALQNLDQLQDQQQQAQGGQRMDMTDLQRMIDEMEEMARSGDRETAQRMLEQIQRMLENLRMQAQQGQQGQQGQGQQTMQQLNDMLREQQGLADRSFGEMQRRQGQKGRPGRQGRPGEQGEQGRQGQGAQPGGEPGRQPGQGGRPGQGEGDRRFGGMDGEAQQQEALRQLLDELRQGLPGGLSPEAEDALRGADEAMGDARKELEGDDPGAALDDQVRAMEGLREGARQLGEAMRQQAQRGQGDRAGRGDPNADARGRDPLGRPTANNGALEGSDTRVPGAEELKRARELLREIRRRSGDRLRPEVELDYLRRLLDRF